MGRIVRSCLQSLLKLVNSAIAMVGIAMIMYALWMFWGWYKRIDGDDFRPPWFIYTFLGLGILLCMIACSGHIAAETINGHCLSCYMVFVFLLFLLEAGASADIFLNKHWEEVYFNKGYLDSCEQKPVALHAKVQWDLRQATVCYPRSGHAAILLNRLQDFPQDSTGRFDEFKNFVRSNFELCKWIGSLIVAAQGLSILLALILRALGPDRGNYYDSDDDYTPPRLPLLKDHIEQHPTYVVDPHFPSKNDTWNKNKR